MGLGIAFCVVFVLILVVVAKLPEEVTKIFLVASWAVGLFAVIAAIVRAIFKGA